MPQNKTVGIFTPFPPQIGGGENYIFTLAEAFSLQNSSVAILSPFLYNISAFEKYFHLDLSHVTYQKTAQKDFFLPHANPSFDYFFCLSSHIQPPVFGQGKISSLIIQFPFPHPTRKLGDKLQTTLLVFPKIASYQQILCYSEFSKKWILRKLPPAFSHKSIYIIPPGIDTTVYKTNASRKNRIMSVGRFFSGDHNKQHTALITAFQKLTTHPEAKDWELHIVGSLSEDEQAKKYFGNVKQTITSKSIFLHPNIKPEALITLYETSKIYWHATGLGNNESISPEKSEHFGITVIEAMAAGLIPFVTNSGGLPEIVHDGQNGFIWETIDELVDKTLFLILHPKSIEEVRARTITKSQLYRRENFRQQIHQLFPLFGT